MSSRVLLVEPNVELRAWLCSELGACYEVTAVAGARAAIGVARQTLFDVALVAAAAAGDGRLLSTLRSVDEDLPVLVAADADELELIAGSLGALVFDFIRRPHRLPELAIRLQRAVEVRRLRGNGAQAAADGAPGQPASGLIGESTAMRRVMAKLPSIARADCSVLLMGESGTGKELAARALHALSSRASGPFVSVNCGALPDALLESELFGHVRGAFTDAHVDRPGLAAVADGGTLLLDEVGEMTPSTQVKLLRFLQEREVRPVGATVSRRVDVRVLAATNRDLRQAIADGEFRADLYHRLMILPLQLPPLRERSGDVALLARHFLARSRAELGSPAAVFTLAALRKLEAYHWPGNVRELENRVRQAVALATGRWLDGAALDLFPAGDEPALAPFQLAKREMVDRFERAYLGRALALADGNVSRAARLAGKHRRAFWELMRKHGLTDGRRAVDREEVLSEA